MGWRVRMVWCWYVPVGEDEGGDRHGSNGHSPEAFLPVEGDGDREGGCQPLYMPSLVQKL